MPLFLLFSKALKRGKNAPFLAYLLNALWYFKINLHFSLVVLDEQVYLYLILTTALHIEPPTMVLVSEIFRIKAKDLMSVLIRPNSFGGVVIDFDFVIVEYYSLNEHPY